MEDELWADQLIYCAPWPGSERDSAERRKAGVIISTVREQLTRQKLCTQRDVTEHSLEGRGHRTVVW